MIELKHASELSPDNTVRFASLVLSSAPVLLPYLFGGKQESLDYITKAAQQADGQYSAKRHLFAYDECHLVGCVTFWHTQLEKPFHSQTLKSLTEFLKPAQISHLLAANNAISQVFVAPLAHQLCVGHLAVLEEYRGRGVAKNMIANGIELAKTKGKTELILDVDAQNDSACGFYMGLGFIKTNTAILTDTAQTFYRMQYKI
jgi:GNAT superfamily N-acetyltransferase